MRRNEKIQDLETKRPEEKTPEHLKRFVNIGADPKPFKMIQRQNNCERKK